MSLLSNLEDQSTKTAFQMYTVKHGIEAMHVIIPLSVSVAFEEAMRLPQLSRQQILEKIHELDGVLE